MEIDEAFARLRRHWWVIVLCLLAAVAGTYVYLGTIPTTYTSKAILQASKEQVEIADQAASLVSTVQAVATAPDAVRRAIEEAGVRRDVRQVIENIEVIGEGPSHYVGLSVRDPRRKAARKLTESLSNQVVDQLNFSEGESVRREIERLEERLGPLQKRKKKLQRLAVSEPTNAQHSIDLGNLENTIAPIQTELDAKRAEESRIAEGRVISKASVPDRPDSSGSKQILGLAVVLGLVIGVMVSAVLEIASPSVPGARRVAKLLGEPLIGTLRGRGGGLTDVGRKLRLAARHNRIDTIVLAGVRGPVQPDVVMALQESVWVPDPPDAGATVWTKRDEPVVADIAGTREHIPGEPEPGKEDDGASTQSFPAVTKGSEGGSANGVEGRNPAATALAAWSTSGSKGVGAEEKTAKLPARPGPASAVRRPPAPHRAASPKKEKQRRLRVLAVEDLDPAMEERRAGMVVIAPPVSKMKQVRTISDLVDVSGWPLLGVVADTGRGPIQR